MPNGTTANYDSFMLGKDSVVTGVFIGINGKGADGTRGEIDVGFKSEAATVGVAAKGREGILAHASVGFAGGTNYYPCNVFIPMYIRLTGRNTIGVSGYATGTSCNFFVIVYLQES